MQHVVAMFGATFLVPVLTGFPPATTILFSGIGTLLFLVITRNRVPSYLGSSFAFIAPVIAAEAEGGIPAALGGIVVCGVLFFLIGLVVDRTGSRLIEWLMPPVVTGAIVALIGLNLAPVARDNFAQQPLIAFITLAAIVLIGIVFRGSRAAVGVPGGPGRLPGRPPWPARSTSVPSATPTGSGCPTSPGPLSAGGPSP